MINSACVMLALIMPRLCFCAGVDACSFSHVLGIDSNMLNVVAAKEMQAKGELHFRHVAAASEPKLAAAAAAEAAASGASSAQPAGSDTAARSDQQQQQEEEVTLVARVPVHVDRDRVR